MSRGRGKGKGKAISFKSLASVGWGEEKRVSVGLQLHKKPVKYQ